MTDTTTTGTTTDATTAPRVWVGCLACYNAGRLVGDWVDAVDAEEFTPCRRTDHDEWWCMDLDGFGAWQSGECSPAVAAAVARAMAATEEAGYSLAAVAWWLDSRHYAAEQLDADLLERFADDYAGCYGSVGEWAAQCWEGAELAEKLPDGLAGYADLMTDAWGRSQVAGGAVSILEEYGEDGPRVHVFTA